MPNITVEPEFPVHEVWTAINGLLEARPFVTTADVSDEVGCTRETARVKLHELEADGQLTSKKVGGRAKVWHRPEYDPQALGTVHDPSATNQPSESGDSVSKQVQPATSQDSPVTRQTDDERVMFFPSRNEIAVDNPTDETRSILSQTGHLVDSTGEGYLYKVDAQDIWNAPYDDVNELVEDLQGVVGVADWNTPFEERIREHYADSHEFRLYTHPDGYLVLESEHAEKLEDVAKRKLDYNTHYVQHEGDTGLRLKQGVNTSTIKQRLYDEGYPVIDERRLEEGASLVIDLVDDIELRDYQREWVAAFEKRNSGVFVGPSGSGKTIAAIGVMASVRGETLVITPSRELCAQWRDELLEKTTLSTHQIGEYHGGEKQIRPVTIATYDTASMSRHRKLFNQREWGLVIADECHHAVAKTWKRFRSIQSVARLGLSATPVRETGDAREIYTLIGPAVGADWGRLFAEGWVEKPDVELVMVPWKSDRYRRRYQRAEGNEKLIEAARNPAKVATIRALLQKHDGQKALVFADWIRQGKELADELGLPFIYGETSHADRERYFQELRDGEREALIVSRVGDEGIDLPDAEVAILGSTMGSSRAQTGQRAGRTMRPFGEAQVYVLLTKGSGEEDWARESTQYLAEKGIDVSKREWSG
jgi:DNA excision repair protein ERCC-3